MTKKKQHKKHEKKKRNKKKGQGHPTKSYRKNLVPMSIAIVVMVVYWLVFMMFEADTNQDLLLYSLGGTAIVTLWILLFAVARYDLDDHGITVASPLGRKRFKWSDLDRMDPDEGFTGSHAATEKLPGTTRVLTKTGGTAFRFGSWAHGYSHLRDDIRNHIRTAK